MLMAHQAPSFYRWPESFRYCDDILMVGMGKMICMSVEKKQVCFKLPHCYFFEFLVEIN